MIIALKFLTLALIIFLATVGGMMAEELSRQRGAPPFAPPASMASLIFVLAAAAFAGLVVVFL